MAEYKLYNKKLILEALYGRGEMVIDALGIEHVRRGNYTFLPCPNPEHDDRRATNCYLSNSGCICKACNTRMNFIDITKAVTNKSYTQTLKFLAELVSTADDFEMTEEDTKTYSFNRSFLSYDDLEFLGLSGNMPRKQLILNDDNGLSIIKEVADKETAESLVSDFGYDMRRSDNGYYIYQRVKNDNMMMLASENPDLYWELVSNKIEEKKQYLTELEEWAETITDMYFYEAFQNIIKEMKTRLLTMHDH